MNVTTSHIGNVVVLRVQETRLTYPILADFATAAADLIAAGEKRILVDLAPVSYVDSATIGCLMDLYRQADAAGGTLKLSGVQKRVETMLTMTGAHNFLEVHADRGVGAREFRRLAMRTITTTAGTSDRTRRRRAGRASKRCRATCSRHRTSTTDSRTSTGSSRIWSGQLTRRGAAGVPEGKPVHELQPLRERADERGDQAGRSGGPRRSRTAKTRDARLVRGRWAARADTGWTRFGTPDLRTNRQASRWRSRSLQRKRVCSAWPPRWTTRCPWIGWPTSARSPIDVQNLVPHELVLEPQRIQHAGLAEHNRVLERTTERQAALAQHFDFLQEAERARRRDLIDEHLLVEVHRLLLMPQQRVIEADRVADLEAIRRDTARCACRPAGAECGRRT